MTDPIKALIAAARESFDAMLGSTDASLIPARRGLAIAILNAEAAQQAAAEARPNPAPTTPSRWDYVQGACYCRACKQEADECECEKALPEPAAEPSDNCAKLPKWFGDEVDSISMGGTTDTYRWGTMRRCLSALGDAVEALAREVRK